MVVSSNESSCDCFEGEEAESERDMEGGGDGLLIEVETLRDRAGEKRST